MPSAMVTLRATRRTSFSIACLGRPAARARLSRVSTKSFEARQLPLGLRDQLIFPEIDYAKWKS